MKPIQYIKAKQQLWANINNIVLVGSKLDRGEKAYTKSLTENLFQPLSSTTEKELKQGDGNELSSGIYPAKIQALHSSSALTMNFFDFWKAQSDKSVIAKALSIPSHNIESIAFEKKYRIFSSSKSPNIDVVFEYKDGSSCAVECKFTEPFVHRNNNGLKEKYLADYDWDPIPAIHKLAGTISPNDNHFLYLHAAQLVKHILGLMTCYNSDKTKFRLVYLYYDVYGEKGFYHQQEINEFVEVVKKDGICFTSITWQDVILNISNLSSYTNTEYTKYLVERYL